MYLIVLIFSLFIIIINLHFLCYKKEQFISYNKNIPVNNRVHIRQYSNKHYVVKIYDSIYFDEVNGNIVELFGRDIDNIDKKVKLISNILILNRSKNDSGFESNVTLLNKLTPKINENQITDTIIKSNKYIIWPNSTISESLKYNYQIIYICKEFDTILQVFNCDINNMNNICTYLFRKNEDPIRITYKNNINYSLKDIKTDTFDTNKYNTFVKLNNDKSPFVSTFQLSKYIYYDVRTRFLLIYKDDIIHVYDGSTYLDDDTPKVINVKQDEYKVGGNLKPTVHEKFKVLFMKDEDGGNFVTHIFIPIKNETVIIIYTMNKSIPGHINIVNYKTFGGNSPNGIVMDPSEMTEELRISLLLSIPDDDKSKAYKNLGGKNEKLFNNIDANSDSNNNFNQNSQFTLSKDMYIFNQKMKMSNQNNLNQPTSDETKKSILGDIGKQLRQNIMRQQESQSIELISTNGFPNKKIDELNQKYRDADDETRQKMKDDLTKTMENNRTKMTHNTMLSTEYVPLVN